jgi:putative glutamine amidotransferase
VVFCGGSDISPELYDARPSPHCGHTDITRDYFEKDMYRIALESDIPMVGICRGSQFLCVMNGGTLVQHVGGHNRDHSVDLESGGSILVNSLHHQMSMPPKDARILASIWHHPKPKYYGGLDQAGNQLFYSPDKDVEAFFCASTRCLGVQWHPEIMNEDSGGYKGFLDMLGCLMSSDGI